MSLEADQKEYLENLGKEFIHGKNILAKWEKANIKIFFEPYKTFSDAISGTLKDAVSALNTYKDFVKEKSEFSAQSKFEPTILEEFISRILKKEFGNDDLMYGGVKAYSSLYFTYTSRDTFSKGVDLKINVKDQDVGIYKEEILTTNDGTRHTIYIPMVCIECKTYLDKTMYEGSVATATKIKNGNPGCLFLIVTETYEVSSNVDIEMTQIDNIYVLRKQRRGNRNNSTNEISYDVLRHMLKKVNSHLTYEKSSVDDMVNKGYLRE